MGPREREIVKFMAKNTGNSLKRIRQAKDAGYITDHVYWLRRLDMIRSQSDLVWKATHMWAADLQCPQS